MIADGDEGKLVEQQLHAPNTHTRAESAEAGSVCVFDSNSRLFDFAVYA